jgi:hypothetical protein
MCKYETKCYKTYYGCALTTAESDLREGIVEPVPQPLRTYQPLVVSGQLATSFTTNRTAFRRDTPSPLSSSMQTSMRTPLTGTPMPYNPYQPFSPVIPIKLSPVTRADRKRMKRLELKTPTVEMVKSTEDIW